MTIQDMKVIVNKCNIYIYYCLSVSISVILWAECRVRSEWSPVRLYHRNINNFSSLNLLKVALCRVLPLFSFLFTNESVELIAISDRTMTSAQVNQYLNVLKII